MNYKKKIRDMYINKWERKEFIYGYIYGLMECKHITQVEYDIFKIDVFCFRESLRSI